MHQAAASGYTASGYLPALSNKFLRAFDNLVEKPTRSGANVLSTCKKRHRSLAIVFVGETKKIGASVPQSKAQSLIHRTVQASQNVRHEA